LYISQLAINLRACISRYPIVTSVKWAVKEGVDINARSGVYFLRTSLQAKSEENIWQFYNTIREVEATIRVLKTDLDLRPIYHQKDENTMAHLHLYCQMALTPKSSKIVFNKPTVLSLYSERSSLSNHFNQDTESLGHKIAEEKINYFLLCSDLPNPVLQKYINVNQNDIILVWENSRFELYKRNNEY